MKWASKTGSFSHTIRSITVRTVTLGFGQNSNHNRHQFTAIIYKRRYFVFVCRQLKFHILFNNVFHGKGFFLTKMYTHIHRDTNSRNSQINVAATSKQRSRLLWKNLTKGKTSSGRYSTLDRNGAQWASDDNVLQRKKFFLLLAYSFLERLIFFIVDFSISYEETKKGKIIIIGKT